MRYVDQSPNDTAESAREAWRQVDQYDDGRPTRAELADEERDR